MPHTVEVPDFGTISFPDEMSEDAIKGVLQKKFPPKTADSGIPQFESPEFIGPEGPVYKPQPPELRVPIPGPNESIFDPLIKKGRELASPLLGPTEEQVASSLQPPGPGILPTANPLSAEPSANEPLLRIMRPEPGYEEKILQSGTPKERRLLGYEQGIAESLNSLTSLNNLQLMAMTAGASVVPKLTKLIGAVFAAHMGKTVAKDIPEALAEEYAKPIDQRDETKIGKLISGGIAQAGLTAVIGAKTLAPSPKGVTDASKISETTEVHGDVRPQPGESKQEVPIEESGGGVQPQAEGQAPRPLLLNPAQEAAREIGFTLNETPQTGGIKLEGLTPEQKAELAKLPKQLEFTDRRQGSPTEGLTFYTPEEATKEQILARHAEKLKESGLEAPEAPPVAQFGASEASKPPEGVPVPPTEQASLEAKQKASVHLQAIDPSPSSRPLGIVAPGAVSSAVADFAMSSPVETLSKGMQRFWRGFSMQSAPRLTEANRLVGEAGVRYAVAPDVARTKGILFSEKVTDGIKDSAFDRKLGTALTEDNLRSIKDAYTKSGETAAASNVRSLIGAENSPFKTEAEYQEFLNRPDTKLAIERHKQLWEEEKDPIFRQANDLDPDTPLDSRGLQTGARINLKNVMEGEGSKTTVGPAARSSLIRQTATLLRKDPFARRAKGTGQSYEGSYRELMAHGYEREYPVAKQHDFIKSMLDSGVAKITEREFPNQLEIGGERAKAYLMRLRPWSGKFLQIPKSLAPEYESISGLTPASRIPYYTKAGEFFTKQSIAGLAEFSTHGANILTDTFLGVGPTANPMINALMKAGLRSDLLVKVPGLIVRAFGDRREEMLKLAEIGAGKRPYTGVMGGLLNRIDQGTRLNAAAIYKRFVDAEIFPDTETGLREFVNQTGNYTKKLQPSIIRWLRDTQVQPFATAHSTFLVRGLREMALAPGAKATSNSAAFALRVEKAAGVIGLLGIVATLNYLISGKPSGPPGTDLGSVGWIGDDGKVHQFSVSKLTGMDRGIRQIGVKGAIEAKRVGLPLSSQLKAAASGAGGTAVQTISGPVNQFLAKAVTGSRPGVPMVQEAKIVPPQGDEFAPMKTQMAENIKTALQQANPAVDAVLSRIQGKSIGDIAQKQLSRFTPRVGQSEQTVAALPKIVHAGDVKAYAESLVKEARKLPMGERYAYILKRFTDDEVQAKDKKAILQQVKMKGALKYK